MFELGMTTHIISNEEMDDIMKIIKSLFIKGVTKTNENEVKQQEGNFLGMLLGTLVANLLGYLLTGKGIKQSKSFSIPGRGIMRAGAGKITASEGTIRGFLMLSHPLANFEIQKC